MSTGSMVPYSNPAGNNQTTPKSTLTTTPASQLPGSGGTLSALSGSPGATVAQSNPLIPAGAATTVTTPTSTSSGISSTAVTGTAPVSATGGTALTPNAANAIDPSAYNQLVDIYGGIGGELGAFEGSIAGTNSATLNEYIASLAPQEATAQANLNASLGAGGVSANSSVAALGNANLQSQEFANISAESANLTQSQQALEANLIESTLPAAAQQVADSSPWHIAGEVLGDIGSVVGDVTGLGALTGGFSSLAGVAGGAGAGSQYASLDNSAIYDMNNQGIPTVPTSQFQF